jgi:hypothetical protein
MQPDYIYTRICLEGLENREQPESKDSQQVSLPTFENAIS